MSGTIKGSEPHKLTSGSKPSAVVGSTKELERVNSPADREPPENNNREDGLFPFLSLPPELRQHVYAALLTITYGRLCIIDRYYPNQNEPRILSYYASIREDDHPAHRLYPYPTLLICRQIHDEAIRYLYSRNTFSIAFSGHRFFPVIGERNVMLLTDIVIAWSESLEYPVTPESEPKVYSRGFGTLKMLRLFGQMPSLRRAKITLIHDHPAAFCMLGHVAAQGMTWVYKRKVDDFVVQTLRGGGGRMAEKEVLVCIGNSSSICVDITFNKEHILDCDGSCEHGLDMTS